VGVIRPVSGSFVAGSLEGRGEVRKQHRFQIGISVVLELRDVGRGRGKKMATVQTELSGTLCKVGLMASSLPPGGEETKGGRRQKDILDQIWWNQSCPLVGTLRGGTEKVHKSKLRLTKRKGPPAQGTEISLVFRRP